MQWIREQLSAVDQLQLSLLMDSVHFFAVPRQVAGV